jgi:hypothetical protein
MVDVSPKSAAAKTILKGLALVAALAAANAVANTYFKCVDAKGAVTVQQTACAATLSQEERKVWSSGVGSGQPTAQPGADASSGARRTDDTAKPKARQER